MNEWVCEKVCVSEGVNKRGLDRQYNRPQYYPTLVSVAAKSISSVMF